MADINIALSLRFVSAMLLYVCLTASTAFNEGMDDPTLYSDVPLAAYPNEIVNLSGVHITDIAQATFQAATGDLASAQNLVLGQDIEHGELKIVASSVDPERLTVQWPENVRAQQIYAVRARSNSGHWSNTLMVNVPQPVWFSPSVITSADTIDPLSRRLQIIGRNLPDALQVRLSGRSIVRLVPEVASAEQREPVLLSYTLPTKLNPDHYQVQYSTDGQQWLAIGEQRLEVRQHVPRPEFRLDNRRFGACRANDLRDDSLCLRQALQAAAQEKAIVVLPAGQWDIYEENAFMLNGVVVPQGGWLRGDKEKPTTLMHHGDANSRTTPLLNLSGENRIEHLWLRNSEGTNLPLIQIGINGATEPNKDIVDIELVSNRFTNAPTAITDTGSAIRNLTIANNLFNIDGTAIYLAGNRYRTASRFRLIDSVIAENIFHATDKQTRPDQAPIASEIGGSLRLNFSGNAALSGTSENAGWRAGFFFHLIDSHENLLIYNNKVHCSGAGGDGEAIALDNNANTYAYVGMQPIVAADAESVTLENSPMTLQNGRPVPHGYYIGQWLQIVAGDGNGQARRIIDYKIESGGTTRFSVSPKFAATPVAGNSKVLISRLFHAPTLIGNVVDNRRPQCARINLSGPQGGAIALWAQTHGAEITGNTQYNTDGIVVQHSYAVPGRRCEECGNSTIRHVSLDISRNDIIDEYDWDSSCSHSGIQLRHGAAPTPDSPPPVLNLNGRIVRNRITHADGLQGGAISFPLAWHAGPPLFLGALIDGTVIEDNLIDSLTGSLPVGKCARIPARIGINLSNKLIRGTVLRNNQCRQVSLPLVNRGVTTLRLCDDAITNTCECIGNTD